MNFFAQQARARVQTKRMLLFFVLAVAAIIAAVDLVVVLALFFSADKQRPRNIGLGQTLASHPNMLVWASIITLIIIALATLYKISELRAGGSAVAKQLGAVLVPGDTTNFAYKRLRNVVEEIAIASGVPVPEIYVLEDELAINAFAAGFTPSDAAVCVTRGCLEKLNREELQGVLAHEFSHVLNGDMRLNIRLMGVLFGILVIALVGQKVLENSGRGSDRNGGWVFVAALAIMIIGYVGLFFGRIIKANISRQREYLADASAVQFTRQTRGISGALKKIGGLAEGSKLGGHSAEEVSHMLFGDGVGYSQLFATHPPLIERIKVLDPSFNPAEFADIAQKWSQPVQASNMEAEGASISGLMPAGSAPAARGSAPRERNTLPKADTPVHLTAATVVAQVANPAQDDYRTADAISTTIPERLRMAAYMQDRAVQLIFAMTLDSDAAIRDKQLRIVEKCFDSTVRQGVEEFAGDLARLHPMQRLPLASMAFPALRRRPRPALQTFLVALNQLIQADGKVALQEYCLAKLISVQVVEALDPSRTKAIGKAKLPDREADIVAVFGILAHYGNDNPTSAERAFRLGLQEVLPNARPAYQPPKDFSSALDRALPALDELSPAGKELLLRGLTQAISADGIVCVAEAELLRTLCAALHCPLPPMLEQAA